MKKSELKQLIKEVVNETLPKKAMYKIMRHRIKGLDGLQSPPRELMTFGQAANWVYIQPPGLSLYYMIVPEDELSSELYKKMKLY